MSGSSQPSSRSAQWAGAGVFVLAALASGRVLLQPGLIGAVDVWPHLVRQQVVAETLREGTSPFWTFLFYGGFPVLRFYGPLLALLGGAAQLLVRDGLWALKLLLFALHGLSGWAMFALLRRRAGPVGAGLGAAAYLLVPWRLISLVTEANLPQSLVYLFLPLLFLAVDGLRPGRLARGAAGVGLWLGLLALAHPYYALMAALLALVVVLLEPDRPARLAGLAGAGALALAVAGFFVFPFLAEYRGHSYPVLPLRVPGPDLRVLLWPWSPAPGYRGFYFGLSIVLGGLVAAGRAARWRQGRGWVWFAAAVALAALGGWVAPVFGLVPAGQPPGRALLPAVFGLAGLFGLGADRLLTRAGKRAWLAGFGLAAVLAVDCLPFIGQTRFLARERALPVRDEAYRLIPAAPTPRLLDLHNHSGQADDFPRLGVYPALGYLFGGLGSALGPPYHQFAPRSMMYVYPWAGLVSAELGDAGRRGLSERARRALALAGVTHVITPPAAAGEGMVMTKLGIDWDDRFLRADRRPPLAFGRTGFGIALGSRVLRPAGAPATPARALTMELAGDWQELLDAAELDSATGMLAAIPVRGPGDSLPGAGVLRVSDWRVRHDRVEAELEAAGGDCWVRLAVSWYPYLDVRLDGAPAAFDRTADGFVYLRCPAGAHRLTVRAPLGGLRTALLPVSLLALAGCGLAGLLPAGRRRKKKGA